MFRRLFKRRHLGRKKLWERPSQVIMRHINGSGGAFELDDLLGSALSEDEERIRDRILDIHQEFRNQRWPVGTSNPASFPSLQTLAFELEQEGK